MNPELYAELIRVARARQTTNYSDISPLIGIDEIQGDADVAVIAAALDEISVHEHSQGRPLLSVVVINKETGRPGQGFYTMAQRLNLYRGGDKDTFFIRQLQAAHEEWGR